MKIKTRMKVVSSVLAAMLCVTGVAGCSPSQNSQKQQTKGEAGNSLEPVTLKLWSCGDKYKAQDEVLAKFCETYKEELNIEKIEFNYVPFGDYEDKMTSLVAGGDDFDGMFVADWMLYNKMSNKGGLLPLNNLLETYAPTLYQSYKESGAEIASSIDGQMVALPWSKQKSSKAILYYRKDLAEKYGVDTSKLETIEDLDAMLMDAKSKVPDITIFESGFPRGNTYSDVLAFLHAKYEMDNMNYHTLTFDLNGEKPELQPVEQTEMFKEAVSWMNKWYNEGIVSKNELSETDTKMFENGKTFAKVGLYGDAVQGVVFNVPNAELGYAELYPDGKYRYDSPLNNAFALNKNAANPERVLMLLELLNTNEEAYDLFMYGIEGTTYKKGDDGSIQFPEGEDATNSSFLGWFCWPFVRSQYDKPSGKITPEALSAENEWLTKNSLVVSPLVGFNPDTSSIKTELAQRDQLYDEQGKLLLAGIVENNDVEAAVNKYIENQKEVGLDKILSFMQEEADKMLQER